VKNTRDESAFIREGLVQQHMDEVRFFTHTVKVNFRVDRDRRGEAELTVLTRNKSLDFALRKAWDEIADRGILVTAPNKTRHLVPPHMVTLLSLSAEENNAN